MNVESCGAAMARPGQFADLRAWLIAAGAGCAIDAAHSIAWRAYLHQAFGDAYMTTIVILFAASPVVVSFIGARGLLSLRCSLRRGALVFLALLLTQGLQALYLDALFPRILPIVAIVGRGFGVAAALPAFALGAWIGCVRARRRADVVI
jgi:hypothetical protein